jgi:hypothetical protein
MKITLALLSLAMLTSCGYTVTISDPTGAVNYTETIDGEINGKFTPQIEPAK